MSLAGRPGTTETDAVAAAKADSSIAKHLEAGKLVKTIFVADKIVNFVVKA